MNATPLRMGGRVIYALTEASARAAEERAVAELDITLADLMRRAGAAVARELRLRVPYGEVAVVAGKGNNGGDGWVAARELHTAGRTVTVYTPVAPDALDGIAGDAARGCCRRGCARTSRSRRWPLDALRDTAAVVDALFGIGFTGEVREPYRELDRGDQRLGRDMSWPSTCPRGSRRIRATRRPTR